MLNFDAEVSRTGAYGDCGLAKISDRSPFGQEATLTNDTNTASTLTRRDVGIGIASAVLGIAAGLAQASASQTGATANVGASSPRRVTILLFPGVTLLDAIGPYELLHRVPNLEVVLAAEQTGPIVADSGLITVDAKTAISDVDHTDVLLIPGGGMGVKNASENAEIMRWITEMDAQSTYTTSVCTGALILARAGLLDGRRATTHFALKDMLTGLGAEYVSERYVRSGKYWTAAGVSAGLDMTLALISELEGAQRAMITQLSIEYDPQPPFDSGSERTAPPEVLAAYRRQQSGQ